MARKFTTLMRRVGRRNVGGAERIVRIISGLAILSLAFVRPQSPWPFSGSSRLQPE
jgi:hypothetical protein